MEIIGKEINCETGEVTNLYADDVYTAKIANIKAEEEKFVKEQEDKTAAKEALLTKLGITAEEAKLLLS